MTDRPSAQPGGAEPDPLGPARLVENAQLAAGVLAARHNGDREAAVLLATKAEPDELLSGALLLAELLAGLYARACDQDPAQCLSELAVTLEASMPTNR